MTGSPVLWSGNAQVSGDTVHVNLVDGKPTTLTSGPNAFVAFEDTALGRVHQIRGDGLVATFRDYSLQQLVAKPQARALYFGGESTGERESAIQFSSSSISLYFQAGEISRIVAATDVEGEIQKFDEDRPPALDGFEWRGEDRPGRRINITSKLLKVLELWPDKDRSFAPPTGAIGTAAN